MPIHVPLKKEERAGGVSLRLSFAELCYSARTEEEAASLALKKLGGLVQKGTSQKFVQACDEHLEGADVILQIEYFSVRERALIACWELLAILALGLPLTAWCLTVLHMNEASLIRVSEDLRDTWPAVFYRLHYMQIGLMTLITIFWYQFLHPLVTGFLEWLCQKFSLLGICWKFVLGSWLNLGLDAVELLETEIHDSDPA